MIKKKKNKKKTYFKANIQNKRYEENQNADKYLHIGQFYLDSTSSYYKDQTS